MELKSPRPTVCSSTLAKVLFAAVVVVFEVVKFVVFEVIRLLMLTQGATTSVVYLSVDCCHSFT